MRIHTKWQNKDKSRSIEQIAGAMGSAIWRIAATTVLNLENEDYQIDTYKQRLQVMKEMLAFLIHMVDRASHANGDNESRTDLITCLARHSAKLYHDNMRDAGGEGDFQKSFVDLLNERMSDYAECEVEDGQPDFNLRRQVGVNISGHLGERHHKWAAAQIMDVEVPTALKSLKRAMSSFIITSKQ